MVVIYVLNVPEFLPVVAAAKQRGDCRITFSEKGYYRVEAPSEIVLSRKQMQMKPAIWYGLFTGGMQGEIANFGREEVRVIGTNKPL